MRDRTRRLVFLALLVAMATALHVVEGMLPLPLPIPGAKLGLANIITLLAIYLYGFRDGLTVALMRVVLGSLISGMFLSPGFMLGLSGAACCTLVMALLLKYTNCFSMIGVSLAGAVGHNLGQLLAACLLLQSGAIIYYLPVLLIAGLPTGFITGFLLNSLLVHDRKSGILRDLVRT
ncbi:MAG: Gx transporter family protein [Desulfuromonadaceae bacterium]|nr:Gx transporter family protein [Desulfuromonadaceae bacterium]MDD5106213.1 Gx transporter family protein [Desulfuromonadaceae bacterium]